MPPGFFQRLELAAPFEQKRFILFIGSLQRQFYKRLEAKLRKGEFLTRFKGQKVQAALNKGAGLSLILKRIVQLHLYIEQVTFFSTPTLYFSSIWRNLSL